MNVVIVTYIVKKGREKEFERTLKRHWKVLRKEDLATNQVPFLLRDPENPTVYKEIFEWKSPAAKTRAHKSPAVLKVWDHMTELTEEGGIEPALFKRV